MEQRPKLRNKPKLFFFLLTAMNLASTAAFSTTPTSEHTPNSKTVQLTYTANDNFCSKSNSPTTLFVHGLDSSSHTWRNILPTLPSGGVAIDLRGNGSSPLGDPNDFRIDTVVSDLKEFVNRHRHHFFKQKFVLVGHSMGGRVASVYAATFPEDVAALVMEDMDTRPRQMEENPIPMKYEHVRGFQRKFRSRDEAVEGLTRAGYGMDMVLRWLDEGRVRMVPSNEGSETYWSDVNPEMRLLAYRHIIGTECGEKAWVRMSAESKFPCHLMVAGVGSVCRESVIQSMKKQMSSKRFIVHRFPNAKHSIHGTSTTRYMSLLNNIICTASEHHD